MRKRYLIIFSLALFLVGLEIGSQAYTLLPYDNFSGIYIDKAKWREGESVIEIDAGSQKLRSAVASINPNGIPTYPHVDVNRLNFVTPTSVNSFQADVTILESSVTHSASATARLEGSFYNDGTFGAGIIGEIFAMVSMGRETNGGLVGEAIIGRLTNAEGTTWNILWYQTFSVSVVIGIPYTLFLAYDRTANQFTFRVDGEEKIVGPDDIPARIAEAKTPSKGLTTVVYVENATSSGYVSATFDKVYKNGIPYDDFSATTIDPARWTNYEFVREISGGKLRSKVRSSSASLSSFINDFGFANPCSINGFQTKFTPVRYENLSSGTAWVDAIIAAQLYHDGTPGGGLTGDVVAKVSIGGPGESPIAFWLVYRLDDETGWNLTDLAYGQFATPISLGTPYTLFLGWDGRQITFKVNNEVATYIPTGTVAPPNRHWKGISTLVHHPNGNEATMEALFEDVMVSGFFDISCGDWASSYIMAIYEAGITTGYGDGRYGPGDPVTREQMSVFILKALNEVPHDGYCGSTAPFADVSADRWSCKYIKRLVELGITTGVGQGMFGPGDPVTREQMAVFMTRALNEVPSDGYCGTEGPFTDVPSSSWSCKYIKRLVELGITAGVGEGLYGPGNPVTRGQMAVFLYRLSTNAPRR